MNKVGIYCLPLYTMPLSLYNSLVAINIADSTFDAGAHTLITVGCFVFCIVWTLFIFFLRGSGFTLVKVSVTNKILLFPACVFILLCGLGILPLEPVIISVGQKIKLTLLIIFLIGSVPSISMGAGLIRMRLQKQLPAKECVIFVICSWIFVIDIILGCYLLLKQPHRKNG